MTFRRPGPALLVAALLVAPHYWLADEIIVMAAILRAIYLREARGESLSG